MAPRRGLQFWIASDESEAAYGLARRAALVCCVLSLAGARAAGQDRVLGLDVSAWQGNISQTTWNNLHNVNDRDFVFIRASRGGTTGYYNQSDPNNNNGQNTLSQRYDDPYFVQNITRATRAGVYAGPYHFARPDIIASTQNSGGIANTGADEADHFIEMAGAWMRPGYLLPVYDFESGQSERTPNQLAQFSIDFSDRIHEVMGIRPAIYTGGNYANYLQQASSSLRDELVAAFPVLWSARWPNQSDPDSIPVQTAHPKDSYTPIYGPWDDPPSPTHPWSFWQYASTGRLSSYNNGNSNLDVNVAQGGIEFVKDHLVPALWLNDSDGNWNTLANWNSGQTPVAPVQGPGQVPRVGPLTLPSERLPGPDDTVILDRTGADIAVTLDSGLHYIRKLETREALHLTGGLLDINYVPSADSTPYSARFSAPVSLDGGALSVHTLQIDAVVDFSVAGELRFDTLLLMPHSSAPASIHMTGDVSFTPLNDAAASIERGAGSGAAGEIDLGGAGPRWQVADGAAAVDLSIDVPIVNGSLTKSGAGTLALGAGNAFEGDVSVEQGTLSLKGDVLSDTARVSVSTGGALDLDFGVGLDVVDSLVLDGVLQPAGYWGAVGSTAQFTTPLITGSGLLRVLTSIATVAGDYNSDGVVDVEDYTAWREYLGAPAGSLPNDADGGVIGADQYATWRANFGATAPAPAAAFPSAAPEPAAALLLTLAFVASVLRRDPSTRA